MSEIFLTFLLASCCVALGWWLAGGSENYDRIEDLLMKANEVEGKVNTAIEKLNKIAAEIDVLKASLENAEIPEAATASFARLGALLQVVDDKNADAVPPQT